MTKERAIELLKNFNLYDEPNCLGYWDCDECVEALYMGIEAIKEQPKRGKWRKRKIKDHQFVQNGYELYYCSVCYKNYSNTVGVEGFDYCPNCGAKMESDER